MNDVEVDQIKDFISQHGYEYQSFLGKGSYSSVILCQSRKYNKQFAMKRAIKRQILLQEYSTLISLNHPNIISLYDSFEDDFYKYLVMDYCPNGTLHEKKRLPYNKFIVYAKQILEGLSYCHSHNIAHRDIKPENIFLDQYDHVKIGDFGFAKQFDNNEKSKEKLGSITFLAPEMLTFQGVCPFKADIWALGITFFFMATGDYPFKSSCREDLQKLIINGDVNLNKYQVDQRVRFLINKMTIKDPKNRSTAEELLRLPIFSPELSKKTLLLSGCSRRNTYSLKFNNMSGLFTNNSSFFEQSQLKDHNNNNNVNNNNEEEKTPIALIDSHCVKSILIYPHIQKMKSHYLLSKPN